MDPRSRCLPVLLAAVLLAACERPSVPPRHPDITVRVDVKGEASADAKASCASGVTATLRRHGFVPDVGGPRVDVEAVLMKDASAPPFEPVPDNHRVQTPITLPADPPTSAELIATVHIGDRAPKVLRSASTAPSDACALATDRLADALREVVDAP